MIGDVAYPEEEEDGDETEGQNRGAQGQFCGACALVVARAQSGLLEESHIADLQMVCRDRIAAQFDAIDVLAYKISLC